MKINCKVKTKYNYKRINTIIQKLPQTIEKSVEQILKETRACAIKLERGHHDDGILCELVDMTNNKVKGRVYTDQDKMPWSWFEHYGTGDYRELEPVGTTKHFLETGGSQWFIPVAKVEKKLGYPVIEINGTQFYVAHGVRANHFMSDAEFTTRETNIETVEKHINELLKEACK